MSDLVGTFAGLVMTVSDSKGGSSNGAIGSVVAGTGLTYTITLANTGPSDASDLLIANSLPGDFAVSSTTGSSSYSFDPSTNSFSLDNLDANSVATFTVTGLLSSGASATSLINAVTASAPDSGIAHATDIDTITREADVHLVLTDNAGASSVTNTLGTVTAGATALTYTFVVSNSGPSDASATTGDTLPAGLTSATWQATPSGGAGAALLTVSAASPTRSPCPQGRA